MLIGNSRWHWAEAGPEGLSCISLAPGQGLAGGAPIAWAAAGPVPQGAGLDPQRRLRLDDVPLPGAPPWLGIDRALVGWRAHRLCGGPVLVADAGTVLSLTRVSAAGAFAGGRLLAGAALQLRAMAAATVALAEPELPPELPSAFWPADTAAAMAAGVLRGLAGAIALARQEACGEEPGCQLRLTGGDAETLAPLLGVRPDAGLALAALAALRPAPDR